MARIKDKNLLVITYNPNNYREMCLLKEIKADLHNDTRRIYKKSNVKTKTYLKKFDIIIDWADVNTRNLKRTMRDNNVIKIVNIDSKELMYEALENAVAKFVSEEYPNGVWTIQVRSYFWMDPGKKDKMFEISERNPQKLYSTSVQFDEYYKSKIKAETRTIELIKAELEKNHSEAKVKMLETQLKELSKFDNLWAGLEEKRNGQK